MAAVVSAGHHVGVKPDLDYATIAERQSCCPEVQSLLNSSSLTVQCNFTEWLPNTV
jgi:hypothetical protein